MNQMPLVTTAAITSVISAVIAVLVAFGVQLTEAQVTAILSLVAVASPWVVALVGHRLTTPLSNPKTESGLPLTGPDGELTDAQTRAIAKGK